MNKHSKSWVVWSAALVLVGWAHSAAASQFDVMAAPAAPQSSGHDPSPGDHAATGDSPADHYGELRVAVGVGGTNSAHSLDNPSASAVDAFPEVTASFLGRKGWWMLGATGTLADWGTKHTFLGLVAGVAVPGETAHFELLAEGGAHLMSHIGAGMFTTTSRDNSGGLPYVGAQARLSIDPGVVKHLAFDLAVTGRFDLARSLNKIYVHNGGFCLEDCSGTETWQLGGESVDLSLGLRYLF
jgi:hypothetical protein